MNPDRPISVKLPCLQCEAEPLHSEGSRNGKAEPLRTSGGKAAIKNVLRGNLTN